jgi:hypothetical protein
MRWPRLPLELSKELTRLIRKFDIDGIIEGVLRNVLKNGREYFVRVWRRECEAAPFLAAYVAQYTQSDMETMSIFLLRLSRLKTAGGAAFTALVSTERVFVSMRTRLR